MIDGWRVRALMAMELRTLVRDRRTVVLSIVLPLVVMPLMLVASQALEARRQRTLDTQEAVYAVTGPRAADVTRVLQRARSAPRLLRERSDVADPAAALAAGTLDMYLEGTSVSAVRASALGGPDDGDREARRMPPTSADGAAGRRERELGLDAGDPDLVLPPDLLVVRIVFQSDREASRHGADRMARYLAETRRDERYALLSAAGASSPAGSVPVETIDVAAESQVAGRSLGPFLTVLVVFFLLTGGAVVAQDTLAGEKERGTLETLLTTAASRREIVWAKVLLVLVVAVAITSVQVINLLVYVGFGVIASARNVSTAITPALAAGLLVFLLPLAALIAGVLVLVSGYARSYREAQLYFLPVMLVGAVPAMAAFLPDISLRSVIALVPIANISVGVKELLVGRVDLPMLAVAWLSTAAASAGAIRAATRVLSTERLIVASLGEAIGFDGAAKVRLGQTAMWFAVMWALVLVVSLNVGPQFDIRGQLAINLVAIFLGGSLIYIRRFGLDARRVLSLRAPHPAVWVAVAAGVPGGLVTTIGIFRLSQLVVPVPAEMIESFSQSMAPGGIPLWQLLPMMTILPGICEEVAFRGVLLDALRSRVRPLTAVLLVGLVFGLFHFSLFRIVQTAALGVLLAAVTMLSRSIFPAMVWHAGSNGLALLATKAGFGLATFEPGTYVAGAALLVASFWILVRTRRFSTGVHHIGSARGFTT